MFFTFNAFISKMKKKKKSDSETFRKAYKPIKLKRDRFMVTKTFDLNSRDSNLQLSIPPRMAVHVCNFCTLNKVLLIH